MRIAQKRQIQDFVKLLGEAHIEIRKCLEKQTVGRALELLAQCQQETIELGTLLEELEGRGAAAVRILEEYCELLYRLHQEIGEEKSPNPAKIYKRLRSMLIRVDNNMKNHIRIRREAVFLPYRASMWDSLESVWMAAVEDEDCDTYVIPVPYYDRNPDGSFRRINYEGGQFPSYVPITDYRSYDFEARRPDMIFIHNPYDDCNHITCVHPFFFSENLKKYTEMLVYIPYFVSGGAGAVSYRGLPYTFYSDYIVTQSEQYSRCFEREVQKKLLPLGTPKFDRILNYRLQDGDIPADWKERLTGKIFFYNTGIGGILHYGGQAIRKMFYVFDQFRDTEATLIWRPHPLLESALCSMRPDLQPLYEAAKSKFREVPHGILDQTPDVDLAVSLSDAYIGERTSSVVHLFGVSGKPVLLTDMNIVRNFDEDCVNVKFYACAMEGEAVWAPAGDRNCLMKINRKGEVEEAYEITGEKRTGQMLYRDIVNYNQHLYLIPHHGEEIAVFDLKTKTFEKISPRVSGRGKFIKGHLYRGRIYMVPFSASCLVELDCESGHVTCHGKIVEKMKKLQRREGPFCLNGSMLAGNELLMAMAGSNHVAVMNLDTGAFQAYEVGEETDNYCCMAGRKETYILGSNEGRKLTYWNRKTGETEERTGYPNGWEGETECFYEMICMDNLVYVFPWKGNMILRISLESPGITQVFQGRGQEEPRKEYYTEPFRYTMVKEGDAGQILAQSACCHGMEIFSMEFFSTEICSMEGDWKRLSVRLTQDKMPYSCGGLFGRQGENLPWAMQETKLYSIKGFMEYVDRETHDVQAQLKSYGEAVGSLDGGCGHRIYRELSRRLEDR